jgi:hypothetical protein
MSVASALADVNIPDKTKLCHSAPFAESTVNAKPVTKLTSNLSAELYFKMHISIQIIQYALAGV